MEYNLNELSKASQVIPENNQLFRRMEAYLGPR